MPSSSPLSRWGDRGIDWPRIPQGSPAPELGVIGAAPRLSSQPEPTHGSKLLGSVGPRGHPMVCPMENGTLAPWNQPQPL